jgi:hypothetical protein
MGKEMNATGFQTTHEEIENLAERQQIRMKEAVEPLPP